MNHGTQHELARLRSRLRLALAVGSGSGQLLALGLALGSLALVLRALTGLESARALWLLLPLALVPVAAYWRAQRRLFSDAALATWLDLRCDGGGLVLTDYELADERWRERVGALLERQGGPPELELGRPLGRAAGALLYACAAVWVPLGGTPPPGPPLALYERSVEDLRTKLETLDEVVEIEEETRAQLERRLEQIAADVEGARSPEATFEAIDQLSQSLEQEAERAQESIARAMQSLAQEGEASADLEQRQQELAQALTQLAASPLAPKLDQALSQRLAASLGESALELGELGELSRELAEALAAQLAQLDAAGLAKGLKPGKLAKLVEKGDLSQFDDHVCDETCLTPGGL